MNSPAKQHPNPGQRPVLTVSGLSVDYEAEHPVHAVRDVDLVLGRGEILGLAGESGCGKSTLAYAVNRLLRPPASVVAGSVTFHDPGGDIDVTGLRGRALREFRWNKLAMVFQGAMNALNPVLNVRTQLEDVIAAHEPGTGKHERRKRCAELLELVGVDPRRLSSYPHELSGGMRQRVMIAMSLALRPDVLVMDEPTTALDVVVQREILAEITRLRAELGFAVVFITHDVSLLLEISDRIAIMYAGRVVEEGSTERLRRAPSHPYTVGLLNSFPGITGERGALHGIPGHTPNLADPLDRCAFAERCPHRRAVCADERPPLVSHVDSPAGAHERVACHAYDPHKYGSGTPASLLRGEFHPTERTEVNL
ncbi:ABC transporter ATP-binding protein [Actinopolyspora erythraea]|uniref:ABC transporter ATP-binding protein n=1 Tax=Actinopolyspora erythraea TaxID=414996 RepID=A0A099D5D6_9ACTN|nr:ABC transporter ATP-binding protein [Actinopolyspora erythraea]ASU79028.1 ABC transporter ATP-binding protein [Actinopolyspora erythraea]KGI81156.1 ABC transporter ATP-binding protein [Actinopolyspora erythraea]